MKVEIGKSYIDSNSRMLVPFEYLDAQKAWMCHIVESIGIDEDGGDIVRSYDDFLTESDILRG